MFKIQIYSISKWLLIYGVSTLSDNGLGLGEEADLEAQMFSFAQKFNRRTELEFSTKTATFG
jgi:hypothetical protein